jgi:hypothetical protein
VCSLLLSQLDVGSQFPLLLLLLAPLEIGLLLLDGFTSASQLAYGSALHWLLGKG